MSRQVSGSLIAIIAVAIIVVSGFAFAYYDTSNEFNSLSSQNANLSQQAANLSQQNANLNQQVAGLSQENTNLNQQLSSVSQQNSNLNQQVAGLNQQLNGLNQAVSTLEQRTLQVVTVTSAVVTVETTTSISTTTQTSITQVPESTLVVLSSTYSNTTKTFTFQVQNTQNYTVYAQLSASLWGQTSFGCNGQIGSYISQVYTFVPSSTTKTVLNLTLGQYVGFCGSNPVTSLQMNYVIPQSTAVSPTYSFNIVPGYDHP